MSILIEKRVLLGITGGIAAYKAAELLRLLRKAEADVQVVMTRAAVEFISPLTFQALSGHPVRLELFDERHEAAMGHIELARWADLLLVAPASADFMARAAAGMADDLLATLCLAAGAPLALAPAMNQAMWRHPATQDNAAMLTQRGVLIWGPAEGDQACGDVGPGRMLEPEQLLHRVTGLLAAGPFDGVRVLVTAGPTREPIDPVRFVGNRS
ncbi:MAG: bifunctional phosphopantothenoylcysteine decarboxylase/phosphopantothenate--cysteine ligase CoaBC, partial [Rhodobacteraceae bacterium]|nr:bifunctional phosphopantothenoylcysteine decarboxylase/phosphopantothenate--cysteine ligase CoaBC [Paracoccaceae bacterium]